MTQVTNKAAAICSHQGKSELVLASSSRYRKALLDRLRIPFACYSPDIDESVKPDEEPTALARRLAIEKARAVAHLYPDQLVIGSDQCCVLGGRRLGKPGTVEAAIEQLTAASGRSVHLLTGVCVMASNSGIYFVELVSCTVNFRILSKEQITAYVNTERPLDCSGSFKSEGLGISLFESIECDDPTAVAGLPLISLVRLLAKHGYDILAELPQSGEQIE